MEFQELQYEVDDEGIAAITLDRPEARNAYSQTLIDSLVQALGVASKDERVRVVLLTGAGRSFSAGGDLQLMKDHAGMFEGDPATLRQQYLDGIQQIPQAIHKFRKPIVVAINGAAIGAGLDLACMGDIRIASSQAKFGSTFIQLGLIPGDGGAYFLPKVVGFPRALELILTGKVINAIEADRIGLVHEIVEPDFLMARAREVALHIAQHPPHAVALAKNLVYRSWNRELDDALDLAATYQGIAQNQPEHDALVDAMIAKTSSKKR